MFKNTNEVIKPVTPEVSPKPIPQILHEVASFTDSLGRDFGLMRLDPEEVRQKHFEMNQAYEEVKGSGCVINQEEADLLEYNFSLYESHRNEFEDTKKAAIHRIKGNTCESAEALRAGLRAIEDEGVVGEQIIESKRGLMGFIEFANGLSISDDIKRIDSDFDSVSNICEFNSHVNTDSLSTKQKEELVSKIRRVQGYIHDLTDELKSARSLLNKINSDDYKDFSNKFGSLASKLENSESDLWVLISKLEE